MTTVICDGESMAADSQQAGDFIDIIEVEKVYKVGDMLVGMAGSANTAALFIKWVKTGMLDDSFPKFEAKSFEAMILKDGVVLYYDDNTTGIPTGMPSAIGSGGGYAIAAVLAGASVEEAVKIACRLDTGSGGKIQCVTNEVCNEGQ